VTDLAVVRISALQKTLSFTLWTLAAVVTSATTGIVIAARFLPGLLLGPLFFLYVDLLDFFHKEAVIKVLKVKRVIRCGRADLVIVLLETTEV
jgi:hypothetical protein